LLITNTAAAAIVEVEEELSWLKYKIKKPFPYLWTIGLEQGGVKKKKTLKDDDDDDELEEIKKKQHKFSRRNWKNEK